MSRMSLSVKKNYKVEISMVRTTRRGGVGKSWVLWLVILLLEPAVQAQTPAWEKFDPHTIATLNLPTDDLNTDYWIVGEECSLDSDCASQLHVAVHSKAGTKHLLTYKSANRLDCMYPDGRAS